ncbi:hypothetical protein DPMN_083074 [Dreissena polymorpha]|uniref:Uncharacterized protein n=1 Tax=Dreissena polymorpha TaxID=45954 RepID=A0A9D4BHX0_DREPO|nr:hypothetical protein DPMN_083074 [Dreissena polymorpha]
MWVYYITFYYITFETKQCIASHLLQSHAHHICYNAMWVYNITFITKPCGCISSRLLQSHSKPCGIITSHLYQIHFAHLRRTNRQTGQKQYVPHYYRGHKNVTSIVNKFLTKLHENWAKNVTSRKNAPPTGGHVFSPIRTIVELPNWENCHYIHIKKNAPPTGGHVFSPIWTNFELVRDINKTNVLTNFHDDWTKIVTSRVFTRKTAPPTGGHVFQQTGTTFIEHKIFELGRDFIGAKLLNKFHEDGTRNVASRVFTSKC